MRTYSEVSHPSPVVPFLMDGACLYGHFGCSLSGLDGGPCCDENRDPACPACGDPIDYCTGHGTIGDPIGARILAQHDEGDHGDCDPRGCDDAAGIA